MSFDTTPICWQQKFKAGEIFEKIEIIPARDGLYGCLSVQGLTEGGSIDVLIQYSNKRELGWIDLTTISFTDGAMDHVTIDKLYPCRFLKFSFTAPASMKVSLVPCFI